MLVHHDVHCLYLFKLYRAFVLLNFINVGHDYNINCDISMRMFSVSLWFPAVPPKPAHLNSPVTEVSLPLGSGNLSVKPVMEGGVEGAIGKGRVFNLISRFEESR